MKKENKEDEHTKKTKPIPQTVIDNIIIIKKNNMELNPIPPTIIYIQNELQCETIWQLVDITEYYLYNGQDDHIIYYSYPTAIERFCDVMKTREVAYIKNTRKNNHITTTSNINDIKGLNPTIILVDDVETPKFFFDIVAVNKGLLVSSSR